MIFYLIRHGDPIYDPDSLTELGHEQAKALVKRFSVYGLDEIYSSNSDRAMLTAKPTCDALNLEMVTFPWANEGRAWEFFTVPKDNGVGREWAFAHNGSIEKFRKDEVRLMGKKWYDHPSFADTNFKNGVLTVDKQCDDFFESLGYRHDRENNRYICLGENHKRVGFVAHQGFGMIFLSQILLFRP